MYSASLLDDVADTGIASICRWLEGSHIDPKTGPIATSTSCLYRLAAIHGGQILLLLSQGRLYHKGTDHSGETLPYQSKVCTIADDVGNLYIIGNSYSKTGRYRQVC